jgi:DNA-binding CsgD family transcriptional regulator
MDFALPHSLIRKATAARGLRKFREARTLLDSVRKLTAFDEQVAVTREIESALLLVAQGRIPAAKRLLDQDVSTTLPSDVQGEYLACRGLMEACVEQPRDALRSVNAADSKSDANETRAITTLTRAVLALQVNEERGGEAAGTAFELVSTSSNFNAFVSTYRAYPRLLTALWRETARRESLRRVIHEANDESVAAAAGLEVGPPKDDQPLSRREQDVYDLLAEGLTNREIAQRLFIAEGTVKVHVGSILEKLGVRSRTEAAIRAKES